MFPIVLNEAKEDRKMSWPGANTWDNACEEETREEEISHEASGDERTRYNPTVHCGYSKSLCFSIL